MKLQTVLLLLVSAVSAHSKVEGAPVLSKCLDLIESGAAQSAANPEFQKCSDCVHNADIHCPNPASQDGPTDPEYAQCAESKCIEAIFKTADAGTKRDAEPSETCTGRLCVRPPKQKRDLKKRCRGRLCGN